MALGSASYMMNKSRGKKKSMFKGRKPGKFVSKGRGSKSKR